MLWTLARLSASKQKRLLVKNPLLIETYAMDC
jgi:hypothetical protein